jgi:hypothetical protein
VLGSAAIAQHRGATHIGRVEPQTEPHSLTDDELADRIDAIYDRAIHEMNARQPDPRPSPRPPPLARDAFLERFGRRRRPLSLNPHPPARTVAEQIAALAGDDVPDYVEAKRALDRIAAQRTAELGAKMLNKGRDVPAGPPVTP